MARWAELTLLAKRFGLDLHQMMLNTGEDRLALAQGQSNGVWCSRCYGATAGRNLVGYRHPICFRHLQ